MTKTIFITLFSQLLVWCAPKENDHYAGYVVDESGKPLSDVLIEENTSNPLKTKTDAKGFFTLKRAEGEVCNLNIKKEGFASQTVTTFNINYEPTGTDGEIVNSSFLTSDTTKIVLKRIKFVNPEKVKGLSFEDIQKKYKPIREENFPLNEASISEFRIAVNNHFSKTQRKQAIPIKEATWKVDENTFFTIWFVETKGKWQPIEYYKWKKGMEF